MQVTPSSLLVMAVEIMRKIVIFSHYVPPWHGWWCHSVMMPLCGTYDVTPLWFHSVMMSLRGWCHFMIASLHHDVNPSWCHFAMMSFRNVMPPRDDVTWSWCHSVMMSLRHDVTPPWCRSVSRMMMSLRDKPVNHKLYSDLYMQFSQYKVCLDLQMPF